MPSLEEYLERADKLAQDVVIEWGAAVKAGNADLLPAQFEHLFDKACRFRTARMIANDHRARARGGVSKAVEAEERVTRQTFAEAYKAYEEAGLPR